MKTWTLLTVVAVGFTLTAMPVFAQNRADGASVGDETTKPIKDEPSADPSGSPKTAGDTAPSAVDPAQSTRTGANVGDGASYNRSNDKGDSPLPKEGPDKTK